MLLLVSVHWAQGQVNYYVSTTGVDVPDRGNIDSPWRTISFAVTQAQSISDDAVINVAAGTYPESLINITEPLVLIGTEGVIVQPQRTTELLMNVTASEGNVIVRDIQFRNNQNTSVGIAVNQVDVLTIASNTFRGFATAIRLAQEAGSSEVNIDQNFFLNFTNAVVVATDAAVANLSIRGNSYNTPEGSVAISNASSSVVNAEYNWWGELADFSTLVSDNVDFSPFLNSGADTSPPELGFQGDFSSITLGGGPSYGTDRNELQEAYDEQNVQRLLLAGNTTFTSLVAEKPATLVIQEDTATIDNLTVNMSVGGSIEDSLFVTGNLLIDSSLALRSGNIKTEGENSQVILGDIGNPLESDGSMRGNFTIIPRPVNTSGLRVLGLEIAGKSGADDLGNVKVTRINGDQGIVRVNVGTEENPVFNESIRARWIIEAERQPVNGRTLRFSWRTEDNNEKDPSAVIAWRLPEGGTEWESVSAEPYDASPGVGFTSQTIVVPNVDRFSTWTISDTVSVLPVTLTDFTARLEESSVRLDWATSSEINSDYFAVERSQDGFAYEPLARTKAAGESQTEQHYLYIDEGVTNRLSGIVYYRLHMVDFDGSSEYSPVVAVSLEGEQPLLVYANRQDGTFKLFGSLPESAYTVQVSDILGHVVYETYLPTQSGVREYTLSVPTLARSVYTLRCFGSQNSFVRKFRVE